MLLDVQIIKEEFYLCDTFYKMIMFNKCEIVKELYESIISFYMKYVRIKGYGNL